MTKNKTATNQRNIMTEKLDLRIGTLAPSVPKQMELQGRVFETKAHGIISYSEADRVANRLVKWLAKHTRVKGQS